MLWECWHRSGKARHKSKTIWRWRCFSRRISCTAEQLCLGVATNKVFIIESATIDTFPTLGNSGTNHHQTPTQSDTWTVKSNLKCPNSSSQAVSLPGRQPSPLLNWKSPVWIIKFFTLPGTLGKLKQTRFHLHHGQINTPWESISKHLKRFRTLTPNPSSGTNSRSIHINTVTDIQAYNMILYSSSMKSVQSKRKIRRVFLKLWDL